MPTGAAARAAPSARTPRASATIRTIAPAGRTALSCAARSDAPTARLARAATYACAGRMKPAASRFVDLRGMRHHLLTWGDPDAPRLVMLHGWMDVGASFQFLVDALADSWHVIAPDLRGFGRTEWQPQGYWF